MAKMPTYEHPAGPPARSEGEVVAYIARKYGIVGEEAETVDGVVAALDCRFECWEARVAELEAQLAERRR